MDSQAVGRLAIGMVLGAFAVLFAIVELARRTVERDVATARLSRHPGSAAISWGEVWDHQTEQSAELGG